MAICAAIFIMVVYFISFEVATLSALVYLVTRDILREP